MHQLETHQLLDDCIGTASANEFYGLAQLIQGHQQKKQEKGCQANIACQAQPKTRTSQLYNVKMSIGLWSLLQ